MKTKEHSFSHLQSHVIIDSAAKGTIEWLGNIYVHAVLVLQIVQLACPQKIAYNGWSVVRVEKIAVEMKHPIWRKIFMCVREREREREREGEREREREREREKERGREGGDREREKDRERERERERDRAGGEREREGGREEGGREQALYIDLRSDKAVFAVVPVTRFFAQQTWSTRRSCGRVVAVLMRNIGD